MVRLWRTSLRSLISWLVKVLNISHPWRIVDRFENIDDGFRCLLLCDGDHVLSLLDHDSPVVFGIFDGHGHFHRMIRCAGQNADDGAKSHGLMLRLAIFPATKQNLTGLHPLVQPLGHFLLTLSVPLFIAICFNRVRLPNVPVAIGTFQFQRT